MQEALETEKRELNVLKEKQEEIKIQTWLAGVDHKKKKFFPWVGLELMIFSLEG